jgi:DNA-directed RNA polymerase subunit RPC12/RpoP
MPRGHEVRVGEYSCQYVCGECGYTASNKTGIRLHGKATHGTNLKDPDKGYREYRCRICKKAFGTTFQLLTHGRHAGHSTTY